MTLNKQEKNILEIIALRHIEDIVYGFLEVAEGTDKTLGIIADKDLIEFAMNETLSYDGVNIRKVDIELDDVEYMLSIDDVGDLVVQPVIDLNDKFLERIEQAYISTEGDVCQDIIDYFLERGIDIVLFGYEDDTECECDHKAHSTRSEKAELDTNSSESTYVSRAKNGVPTGFSKTWYSEESGVHCYSSYSHYSNDLDALRKVASGFNIKL